ncbi:hypothetical protein [Streptomyces yaizuensis]|uniref:DNA-binding protein n=1 Tax=Streptomyces yaizuensis TaxID=2989713 RepID=A0ABQ5P6N3_9ACTN|nr:hypothetical protein [Streptomyces sp. YSPA8]GLF98232.1 hypothetical protein SYYSPA8_28065 [Streptomyces sp. YSPA8]
MTDWNVYVEYDAPDTSPEVYGDLFEALSAHAPGVGPAPNGNLSLRLTLEADQAHQAVAEALTIAAAAVHDLGLHGAVVGIEVLTEAEFDRRQTEPAVPDLAGTAEAAAIIGVSKTLVKRLITKGALNPVQHLAAGPVFVAAAVQAYADKKHNRTTNRPLDKLDLSPAERDLLALLNASADQTTPPATTTLPAADHVIAEVYDNARIRIHRDPDDHLVTNALTSLVEHKLVRTRRLYRHERETGNTHDAVVTVLPKGRRHAPTPINNTEATM